MTDFPFTSRIRHYRIVAPIDNTLNSTVKLAVNTRNTEKVILKFMLIKDKTLERIDMECFILSNMSHKYIIPLREFFDENGFRVMVMLHGKSNLRDYFVKNKVLDIHFLSIIMYRCLKGLDYIHQTRVLHGDIKPENLVFLDETRDDPIPAFIDFGFAQVLDDQHRCTCRNFTMIYASPEQKDFKGHSFPSDIWSLGLTFSFILTGKALSCSTIHDELMDIAKKHYNCSHIPNSEDLSDLILHMVDPDESSRWTIKQCLSSSFFTHTLTDEWIAEEERRIGPVTINHITEALIEGYDILSLETVI